MPWWALSLTGGFCLSVRAATWFVATTGSDANPGTLEAPFRTIQRAAEVAQPGDVCLIRGGIYRETVHPPRSGEPGRPIVFRPYEDEIVVINGANPISQWQHESNHIWSAEIKWDLGKGRNQVFVDGLMVPEARYPNMPFDPQRGLDLSHPVLAEAQGSLTNRYRVTLWDPNLPRVSLLGAQINFTDHDRVLTEGGLVVDWGPGWLTAIALGQGYGFPEDNATYFVWGSMTLLDAPGEWFFDGTRLYLWPPGNDNPTAHRIEVKRRHLGFDLADRAYITLQGLHFFACTISTRPNGAVAGTNAHHIVLEGIHARYLSHDQQLWEMDPWREGLNDTGIILHGDGHVLRDSTLAYSSGNGVALCGRDCRIINNIIHDVNYVATDCAAITTHSAQRVSVLPSLGHEIAYNTLYNSGRGLINHRKTGRLRIHHNHMFHAQLQTGDGGATYAYETDGDHTEIAYNFVHDVTGYMRSRGIYLDNRCLNFDVHHNVVFNCDGGISVNGPARHVRLAHNTVLGWLYSIKDAFRGDLYGSEIVNNLCVGPFGPVFVNARLSGNVLGIGRPGFQDPFAWDFRLQAGAAGVDAGDAATEFAYEALGQPDAGAYEVGRPPWNVGAWIEEPQVYGDPPLRPAMPGHGFMGACYAGAGLQELRSVRWHDSLDIRIDPTDRRYNLNPSEPWSGKWVALLEAPVDGVYDFLLFGNAAARLSVGGGLIAQNAANDTGSGRVRMDAGQRYRLELEVPDHLGSADIQVLWALPGQSADVIPSERLYPLPTFFGNERRYLQPAGQPPSVALIRPVPNQSVSAGAGLVLEARVYDPNGFTNQVDFFDGAQWLASVQAMDVARWTWTNPPVGTHQLFALVQDQEGLAAASDTVPAEVLPGQESQITLVAARSVWRYFEDRQQPGTNWMQPDFDDSGWMVGFGVFGFGEPNREIRGTEINYGPNRSNKPITYYFRHRFQVTDPASVTTLTLRLLRDDGAVVYLNGAPVLFSNMLPEPPTYDTLAMSELTSFAETNYWDHPLDPARLVAGENVLAVEVHLAARDSLDMNFDLALEGTRTVHKPRKPKLVSVGPAPAR